LKKYLLTGLLVTGPVAITIFSVWWLVQQMDRAIFLIPPMYRPEALLGFEIPGLGVIITVFILLVVGMLARNILGRKIVSFGEGMVERIPFARSIYSTVKQVFQTMFAEGEGVQRRVVLVEYPRKGCWALAFATGPTMGEISRRLGFEGVNVFIPTTPNPTSGYYVVIPKDEVVETTITAEEAFKAIVSAGVMAPNGDQRLTARLPGGVKPPVGDGGAAPVSGR